MFRTTIEMFAMLAHLVGYGIVSALSFWHRDDHCVPYLIITLGTIIHVVALFGGDRSAEKN